MNDRIRAREVRLVDPDGNQLGIKVLPEALAIARSMDLDLVEVAPLADPPVCRIMDYGKFKFDEAQRAKESRRKASNVGIKEMKYRPKIGQGDFDTKTRQVARFLAEGHKVKVTIMFRGREVFHPELGKRILDKIAETVGETARVESEARLDGRNMVMVLAPDKRARQAQAARHAQVGSNGTAPEGGAPAGAETSAGAAAPGTGNAAPAAAPATANAAPATANAAPAVAPAGGDAVSGQPEAPAGTNAAGASGTGAAAARSKAGATAGRPAAGGRSTARAGGSSSKVSDESVGETDGEH